MSNNTINGLPYPQMVAKGVEKSLLNKESVSYQNYGQKHPFPSTVDVAHLKYPHRTIVTRNVVSAKGTSTDPTYRNWIDPKNKDDGYFPGGKKRKTRKGRKHRSRKSRKRILKRNKSI